MGYSPDKITKFFFLKMKNFPLLEKIKTPPPPQIIPFYNRVKVCIVN